jgi:hypothetical protein
MHVHQRNGVRGRVHVCYPTGFRFHSTGFYHPLCRNKHIPHGFILLWNRLTTIQDTHDQERNASSVSLVMCTRFGCARDWEDKQQWLTGEVPSATVRLYSNGRNSYSSLVPYTRRTSKIVIFASFFLVLLVRFNALLLVSKSSRTFSQTFWNCLVFYEDNLVTVTMSINPVRRKYLRHIDICRRYVRDLALTDVINESRISTT